MTSQSWKKYQTNFSKSQSQKFDSNKINELMHTLIECRIELKNQIDLLNQKLTKTDDKMEAIVQNFSICDSMCGKTDQTSFAIDSPYVSFTNDNTSFRNLNSLNDQFLMPTKNLLTISHENVHNNAGLRNSMKKSVSLTPNSLKNATE